MASRTATDSNLNTEHNMRYIVFMSDCDEQQAIVDFSDRETRDEAIEEHMEARDCVCHAQAYTPDELRSLANEIERWHK